MSYLFKCKKIIESCNGTVLLNKNINAINDNTFNDYYLDYYIKCLNDQKNTNIYKYLNFEGLYNKLNQPSFVKLDLKSCFNANKIIEINFSENSIDDESMLKFFKNTLVLINLEKVNLSNNKLTEKFIDKLISDKILEKCANLKKIDFSNNKIKFRKDIFINFLKILPQLETLIMKFTPFEDKFEDFMKKKINIFYEDKYKRNTRTKIDQEYKDVQEIIEQYFLNVNPLFKLILWDLIKSKYTSKIKKYFPFLLNNIQLEEC